MRNSKHLAACLFLLSTVAGCDAPADSKAAGPGDKAEASAPKAAKPTNPTYTCNMIEKQQQCYTVAPLPALVTGEKAGCAAGTWSEGKSCPTQERLGTCKLPYGDDERHYYKGVTADKAKEHCEVIGGSFSAA